MITDRNIEENFEVIDTLKSFEKTANKCKTRSYFASLAMLTISGVLTVSNVKFLLNGDEFAIFLGIYNTINYVLSIKQVKEYSKCLDIKREIRKEIKSYTQDNNDILLGTDNAMLDFKKKSYFETLKMEQKKLEEYYRQLRIKEFCSKDDVKGIELRKKIHKAFLLMLKINRVLNGQNLTIIGDKHIDDGKPKIYAVTHVGRYDIESSIASIKNDAHLLMGDPGEVYKSLDYFLLKMNGIVFADTDNKIDRYLAKEKCVDILKQNGSILIFPEGAWNITPNYVVMPLYTGCVEMAIRTGTEIIPVAIEQYGKNYFANIGKNFNVKNSNLAESRKLSDELQSEMAALKLEIWEHNGANMSRADMGSDYSQKFLDSIMSETSNGYTVEEINRTKYHNPKYIEAKDVFNYDLNPNSENAFLYSKRLHLN